MERLFLLVPVVLDDQRRLLVAVHQPQHESAESVDQSLIDTLFGGPATPTQHEVLPKGLGAEAGRLVLQAVRDAGEVSAAECAARVGIHESARGATSSTT